MAGAEGEAAAAILVVDAQAFFRAAMVERLAAAGHAVRAAADLAAAAADLADPDVGVLVLDLESAGPAAVEALRRVRAERPATRAIVLARHTAEARVLEALRAGACDYLAKPLHEEELLLAVERALSGFRADRELTELRAGASGGADADADLALARDLCEAVVGEGDPATLPARLLAILAERVGATGAALYLSEPGGGRLAREASWEAGRVSDPPFLAPGRGLSGAALGTGGFVATSEPERDPRFDPEIDRPEAEVAGAGVGGGLLCLPLRFRRNPVGLVRVHLPPGVEPSLRTAEIAAAALSAALRSVLLYRSWRSSIDEVARIRRESASRPGAQRGTGPGTPGGIAPPASRPAE